MKSRLHSIVVSCGIYFLLLRYGNGASDDSTPQPPTAPQPLSGDWCSVLPPDRSCCNNRTGSCSASLPGPQGKCYCDYTCLRAKNNDCCPDFVGTCGTKAPITTIPPATTRELFADWCSVLPPSHACCENRTGSCAAPLSGPKGKCFCDFTCLQAKNNDCCPDFHGTCGNVSQNTIKTTPKPFTTTHQPIIGDWCAVLPPSRSCCRNRTDACSITTPGPKGKCYCDYTCLQAKNNDCCPDFARFCGGNPAAYNIPSTTTSTTVVPTTTQKIYADWCAVLPPSRACCKTRAGSCSRALPGPSGKSCYCDYTCLQAKNNDCCPDFIAMCGREPRVIN